MFWISKLLKCLQSQKRLGRSSLQCDQIILIIYCDVSHRQKTIGGYDHKTVGSNATSDIPKCFWLGERLVIGWDFRETCYWNIPIQQPQGTLWISPPPYLSSRHWSKEAGSGPLRFQNKIGEPLTCDSCPFTVEGLDVAPKNCKKSSRGQTVYLWKCLHGFRNNSVSLLSIMNKWWAQGEVPQETLHARVVPIFKKGDVDDSSNYRPISLWKNTYKIFTTLVRGRIQTAAKSKVSRTQFGFRPGKSTAHATFSIRCLQDWSEEKTLIYIWRY